MKKVLVAITCLFMLMLAGCSNRTSATRENDLSEATNITFLDEGVWPDNKYTQDVPAPDGTIGWVMLDEEHDCCTVEIKNMQEMSFGNYLEYLEKQNYSTISEVSEEIKGEGYTSYGINLTNQVTWLSLAYGNGTLVIRMMKSVN